MTHQLRVAVLAMSALMIGSNVSAGPVVVTLDTSSLSGTQTVGFSLTNFDPSANTVLLSDFAFGGGNAVPATTDCTLLGTFSGLGCSGDLATGVTLEDLDPTAAFFLQQFQPGVALSFTLDATMNASGLVPDQLSMIVCNASFTTCYSDDAGGALLVLDQIGGSVSPASFVLFGASADGLPAPVVTFAPTAPEPAIMVLLAGASALHLRRRRSRRTRPRTTCDVPRARAITS